MDIVVVDIVGFRLELARRTARHSAAKGPDYGKHELKSLPANCGQHRFWLVTVLEGERTPNSTSMAQRTPRLDVHGRMLNAEGAR
jgi:hypothetical protein